MTRRRNCFDLGDECGILKVSIVASLFVSALGIGFGLASGSFSIVFDGVYSLIDASMSMLSLLVVQLITSHAVSKQLPRSLNERFSMGFWHLEPMVLALNGVLMIAVAVYALTNAVISLRNGGRELEFGWAIIYALVTALVCAGTAAIEARANRRIRSEFIRLDISTWVMSAGITSALLAAFCVGYLVKGTRWEWLSSYIDPAILALVCLLIIPIPVSTIRRAMADILVVTPADLKRHVDSVAKAFVEKHGLAFHRAYVARIGRSQNVEVYFIVPPETPARAMAEWDALRDEIGEAIGGEGPNRWLTVVFTGDPGWAE